MPNQRIGISQEQRKLIMSALGSYVKTLEKAIESHPRLADEGGKITRESMALLGQLTMVDAASTLFLLEEWSDEPVEEIYDEDDLCT